MCVYTGNSGGMGDMSHISHLSMLSMSGVGTLGNGLGGPQNGGNGCGKYQLNGMNMNMNMNASPHQPSPTINTKCALSDINAMFEVSLSLSLPSPLCLSLSLSLSLTHPLTQTLNMLRTHIRTCMLLCLIILYYIIYIYTTRQDSPQPTARAYNPLRSENRFGSSSLTRPSSNNTGGNNRSFSARSLTSELNQLTAAGPATDKSPVTFAIFSDHDPQPVTPDSQPVQTGLGSENNQIFRDEVDANDSGKEPMSHLGKHLSTPTTFSLFRDIDASHPDQSNPAGNRGNISQIPDKTPAADSHQPPTLRFDLNPPSSSPDALAGSAKASQSDSSVVLDLSPDSDRSR